MFTLRGELWCIFVWLTGIRSILSLSLYLFLVPYFYAPPWRSILFSLCPFATEVSWLGYHGNCAWRGIRVLRTHFFSCVFASLAAYRLFYSTLLMCNQVSYFRNKVLKQKQKKKIVSPFPIFFNGTERNAALVFAWTAHQMESEASLSPRCTEA